MDIEGNGNLIEELELFLEERKISEEKRAEEEQKLHYLEKFLTEKAKAKNQEAYHCIMLSSYGGRNGKFNLVFFPFEEKGTKFELDIMDDYDNEWRCLKDERVISFYLFKGNIAKNMEYLKEALCVLYMIIKCKLEGDICEIMKRRIKALSYREEWMRKMSIVDIIQKTPN